jgi:hypothetical protein
MGEKEGGGKRKGVGGLLAREKRREEEGREGGREGGREDGEGGES